MRLSPTSILQISLLGITLSLPQISFAGRSLSRSSSVSVPHLYEIVCKPETSFYKNTDLTEIRESILSVLSTGSGESNLEMLDYIGACTLIISIKAQLAKGGCVTANQNKNNIPAAIKKCEPVVKNLELNLD